jgi:hypothetical protein
MSEAFFSAINFRKYPMSIRNGSSGGFACGVVPRLRTIDCEIEFRITPMQDVMPKMLRFVTRRALLSALALLAACASVPAPQRELDRARSALAAAEAAGAAEGAPVDLRLAREEIDHAGLLIAARKHEQAQRLLIIAEARAELARAKSEGARLRAEVQAKEQQNAQLRRELLGAGSGP